uniref:molybdopterin molybdotransferase n=1 Tax=Ascaris suum TaxID=6253 RepID=F1LG03_ASCSU
MRIAILTVSDSVANGTRIDTSGATLRSLIEASKILPAKTVECCIVADEKQHISDMITELCTRSDVVITTGGTGFAIRDVTPEATLAIIDRRCGGLETALHMRSLQSTPLAALSRLCAGIKGQTLVVNLPGSTKAVKECFEVLEGILPHAVHLIKEDRSNVEETHCSLHSSSVSSSRHSS